MVVWFDFRKPRAAQSEHMFHTARTTCQTCRTCVSNFWIWFSLFYAFGSSAQAQVILAWLEARERACPHRMGAVVGCCHRRGPLIRYGLDRQRELEAEAAPFCPQPASPGGSVFQRSPRSRVVVCRRSATPPLDSDVWTASTEAQQATPRVSAAQGHHHVHGGGHRRRRGAAGA